MFSLQALTMKNILDNFVINDETKPIIEQYIADYLSQNPNFINNHLDKNGLYHVFFRQRDPFVFGELYQKDMELLKSFVDKESAIKWIIENGKIIVEEQEENYADNAIVLVLIRSDNNGSYCMGEGPNRFSCISFQKHESFAFSPNGYLMLLREHTFCVESDHYPNTDPIWIHYHKNDGNYINSLPSLKELPDFDIDHPHKQFLAEIVDFYSTRSGE